MDVIAKRGAHGKKLQQADHVKLAHAVKQTVASITIGMRVAKTRQIEHIEYFGELRLHEALRTKPILLPDNIIGRRKVRRDIGELVRQSDHPLHLADFCKYIGTKDESRVAHHVRRAEKAGLMRKIGHQGGWVVCDYGRSKCGNAAGSNTGGQATRATQYGTSEERCDEGKP
jgi:hypothetical protein